MLCSKVNHNSSCPKLLITTLLSSIPYLQDSSKMLSAMALAKNFYLRNVILWLFSLPQRVDLVVIPFLSPSTILGWKLIQRNVFLILWKKNTKWSFRDLEKSGHRKVHSKLILEVLIHIIFSVFSFTLKA